MLGKRLVTTRLHHIVTIREENAITALEVISRFAVNPKWLIYLPPTMSPTETSQKLGVWNIPMRPLPISATNECRASFAKRSTWDRAPSSLCVATRKRRGSVLESPAVNSGFVTPVPDGDSSTTPYWNLLC